MRSDPRSLGVLLALVLLTPARRSAADCSCVERPPEKLMGEADQVFLGRYLRPGPEGDGSKLRFDVLLPLKGEVGHTFELPRSERECERSFQDKELSLVLVVKGHIPTCGGNFDLDKVVMTLGEYLALGSRPATAPSLEAVKLALTGRIGHAKKVSLYAPTLVGKTTQIGRTKVTFVDTKGAELAAVSGATSGAVSWIVFRTPESIATWLIVAPVKGRPTVVYDLKRDLKIK